MSQCKMRKKKYIKALKAPVFRVLRITFALIARSVGGTSCGGVFFFKTGISTFLISLGRILLFSYSHKRELEKKRGLYEQNSRRIQWDHEIRRQGVCVYFLIYSYRHGKTREV